MFKKTLFISLFSLMLVTSTIAQTQEPVMEIPRGNGKLGASENVVLHTYTARVNVFGNLAVTTVTLSFRNNSGRVLEGRLTFPLPEDATVSGFALDINGHMRQAVPVEKSRATEVFESIERRGVDPGILEKTAGNNFRTRVYPLPPKGIRTIELTFQQVLHDPDGETATYYLPLPAKKLADFGLDVSVHENPEKPALQEKPDGSFDFIKKGNVWTASIRRTDYHPDKALRINLPEDPRPSASLLQKRDHGKYYFISRVKTPVFQAQEAPKPRSIAIVWDNSLSRYGKDTEKEKAFLKAYFRWNKTVKVELYTLNTRTRPIRTFDIREGNIDRLLESIDRINYDGGTDLGIFKPVRSEACLFFSDGLSTFGDRNGFSDDPTHNRIPIHTIVSDPVADFGLMKYISKQSNGTFFNLNALDTDQLPDRIKSSGLAKVKVEKASGIMDTYTSDWNAGQKFVTVTGVLSHPYTMLQLTVTNGVETERVFANLAEAPITGQWSVVQFWAQDKINALELNYQDNKQEVAVLGKKYGLVTKNTSLIVLETLADYIKYEIVPPGDLKADYYAALKQRDQEIDTRRKNTLEVARTMMDELKTWWNTDYPVTPPKKGVAPHTDPGAPMEDELQEVVVDRLVQPEMGVSENDMVSSTYKTATAKKRSGTVRAIAINSDAEYMKALEQITDLNAAYAYYLELRKDYRSTPSFYFDMAGWFLQKGDKDKGVLVLSNLTELELEQAELYKTIAYVLKKYQQKEKLLFITKKILEWRPMDMQSYRDYALALEDNKQYQQALDVLYAGLTREYTQETQRRDLGIEEVILFEMNRIISKYRKHLDLRHIDKQLIGELPVDIRVALNWNMDHVDIDLHVTDPKGEECYYSHKNTRIGGRLSADFTDGFGPEQFVLKKAAKGKYQIKTNFFGEQRVTANGPSTLMAEVFLYYASGREERKIVVFESAATKKGAQGDKVLIAEFEF